jgi:hypothetical protein
MLHLAPCSEKENTASLSIFMSMGDLQVGVWIGFIINTLFYSRS